MVELLKENGIGLPPAPPEPPEACLEDIPVGARIIDPAIAAGLSALWTSPYPKGWTWGKKYFV